MIESAMKIGIQVNKFLILTQCKGTMQNFLKRLI